MSKLRDMAAFLVTVWAAASIIGMAPAAADPLMPAERFAALPPPKSSATRLYFTVPDPSNQARLARAHPGTARFSIAPVGPAYEDLFKPGSPGWSRVRPYIGAFGFSMAAIRNTDPATLRARMQALQGVPIAVISDGMPARLRVAGCGEHLAGYSQPGTLASAIRLVQAAGGKVAYVVWDEPLFIGHMFTTSPNREQAVGCRTPIPQLASALAETAASARAVAPRVQFIEQFPIPTREGVVDPKVWPQDIAAWLAAEKANGIAPILFIADIIPTHKLDTGLLDSANAQFRAAGIPFVDNCDGTAHDTDEASWAAHARANCDAFNSAPGATPSNWVVVDSWHVMPPWGPETDPDSAMGIAAALLGINP